MSVSLPDTCNVAFKEWAAVCEALAAGRQTIILRKGGIHEGREGFRVQHERFWLYPTNFHQAAECLAQDAGEFIERGRTGTKLSPGELTSRAIRLFAEVSEIHELTTEAAALRLADLHIWSEATIRQRFAYRQPGLFLLVVRVSALEAPVTVRESLEMAGCKSWVELPVAISTTNLAPIISDEQFGQHLAALRAAR